MMITSSQSLPVSSLPISGSNGFDGPGSLSVTQGRVRCFVGFRIACMDTCSGFLPLSSFFPLSIVLAMFDVLLEKGTKQGGKRTFINCPMTNAFVAQQYHPSFK